MLDWEVERWSAPLLKGRIIQLEPLARSHLDELWEASRDERVWRWLPVVHPRTRDELAALVDDALARAAEGAEIPSATVWSKSGRVAGSTRFLALRPEHRSAEIGWAWLRPEALGPAQTPSRSCSSSGTRFQRWACRRVELKTDALNMPTRRSMEAFGAVFGGIHRKHMLVRDGESRDTPWYSVIDDEWPGVHERLERLVKG